MPRLRLTITDADTCDSIVDVYFSTNEKPTEIAEGVADRFLGDCLDLVCCDDCGDYVPSETVHEDGFDVYCGNCAPGQKGV